mmetsp:Transcript_19012/g.38719  ORF Transcript_19012/g.38719 Transcript_19012/m.38719 type:complete len:213 (-) Transcript_19012:94-732(-)
MAQLLLGRWVTHLVAFGVGALALRLVRGRHDSDNDNGRDDDDDNNDDDDHSEGDEDDDNRARQMRLSGHAVRDDYSAEAEADETFKMLLLCNMELYRLSSKTGEMKAVKMSAGKAAAQCSHATLGAYRRGVRLCPRAVRAWLRIGQMKITLKCPSVDELLMLEEACAAAGINTYLIRDAGHTEIEPGSRTVLAVGPAPASAIDPLCGHLKPY